MSTVSNSPRLIKGALVGVDLFNPLASVVVFQYNPDTMTCLLDERTGSESRDRGGKLGLSGPPRETRTLKDVKGSRDPSLMKTTQRVWEYITRRQGT